MALDDESLQLEKVGYRRAGRLPVLLAAAAVAFVALALVKPWPAPTTGPNPRNHPRTAAPTATASATGLPAGGEIVGSIYFRQCFPTANWRLTAIQDDGSMAVRTVWPAAPAFTAIVSADADSVRLYGSDVQGIGFCAPGNARAVRVARAANVSLWRRDSSGAIVPVDGARVIDRALAREGEVYLAPPGPPGAGGTWPAGDYFFEIRPSRAGSGAGWLALQILAVPAGSPSPAPIRTLGVDATVYRPLN
jgi:hypothetical protein